jgi:hypothetical protein
MVTAGGAVGIFLGLYLMVSDRSACMLLPELYRCTLPATTSTLYKDVGHLVLHTRLKPILCATGIAADTALLPRVIVDPLAYAPIF